MPLSRPASLIVVSLSIFHPRTVHFVKIWKCRIFTTRRNFFQFFNATCPTDTKLQLSDLSKQDGGDDTHVPIKVVSSHNAARTTLGKLDIFNHGGFRADDDEKLKEILNTSLRTKEGREATARYHGFGDEWALVEEEVESKDLCKVYHAFYKARWDKARKVGETIIAYPTEGQNRWIQCVAAHCGSRFDSKTFPSSKICVDSLSWDALQGVGLERASAYKAQKDVIEKPRSENLLTSCKTLLGKGKGALSKPLSCVFMLMRPKEEIKDNLPKGVQMNAAILMRLLKLDSQGSVKSKGSCNHMTGLEAVTHGLMLLNDHIEPDGKYYRPDYENFIQGEKDLSATGVPFDMHHAEKKCDGWNKRNNDWDDAEYQKKNPTDDLLGCDPMARYKAKPSDDDRRSDMIYFFATKPLKLDFDTTGDPRHVDPPAEDDLLPARPPFCITLESTLVNIEKKKTEKKLIDASTVNNLLGLPMVFAGLNDHKAFDESLMKRLDYLMKYHSTPGSATDVRLGGQRVFYGIDDSSKDAVDEEVLGATLNIMGLMEANMAFEDNYDRTINALSAITNTSAGMPPKEINAILGTLST